LEHEPAPPNPGEPDAVAVIFTSKRTAADAQGYTAAALRMAELVASMPGYLGVESARGADGVGITVSYWTNEESALAWRRHPEHLEIQRLGRERWYEWFELRLARVERHRRWVRQPDATD
jgi:heme-degrading monooxygenase HmoA